MDDLEVPAIGWCNLIVRKLLKVYKKHSFYFYCFYSRTGCMHYYATKDSRGLGGFYFMSILPLFWYHYS